MHSRQRPLLGDRRAGRGSGRGSGRGERAGRTRHTQVPAPGRALRRLGKPHANVVRVPAMSTAVAPQKEAMRWGVTAEDRPAPRARARAYGDGWP